MPLGVDELLAASPHADAAVPEGAAEEEREPLELTETATAADAEPETTDASNEELVLGADAIVGAPPSSFTDDAYAAAPAASEDSGRRRWLAPGTEADDGAAEPAPRVKLGGTLFERMSNAARGAQRDEGEGERDPVDIPRFLHRQNNQ